MISHLASTQLNSDHGGEGVGTHGGSLNTSGRANTARRRVTSGEGHCIIWYNYEHAASRPLLCDLRHNNEWGATEAEPRVHVDCYVTISLSHHTHTHILHAFLFPL